MRETDNNYECQKIDKSVYTNLEMKKNEIREERAAKTKLLTHPGRGL